jgi:hypothetical protein
MSNVARRIPQVKRLSVAAAPAIGFVHGGVERHRVDARELHSEYLQAESQHPLLDYSRQRLSSWRWSFAQTGMAASHVKRRAGSGRRDLRGKES